MGKPVLIGGVTSRGVVASCSYEARRFGIKSAMPMRMAQQLCPDAIVIRGDSGLYSKYSHLVTEIIREHAPLYEKSSVDEFYLDLTGMDHFFGCYKWATELRTRINQETGLPLSMGLSINKTVSKISTNQAKPNGQMRVLAGQEKRFLSPLSLQKIPSVGDKTFTVLREMGLERVHTVQQMPRDLMLGLLGLPGGSIWDKCQGIDQTPVVPYTERKSISIERTFEQDTIDVHKMRSIILAMAENLAFQLRNGVKLTSCVTVKIRYADMNVYSKQRRVSYTACDQTLIKITKELFERLYDRRLRVRLVATVTWYAAVSKSIFLTIPSNNANFIKPWICCANGMVRTLLKEQPLLAQKL